MAVMVYYDFSLLDRSKIACIGYLITEFIERLNVSVVIFKDGERLGAGKM